LVMRPNPLFKLLGISRDTGYRLIREGRLTVSRLGPSCTLVHVDSIRRLLAETSK
jgi:excisionase family DNA binding protein